MFWKRNGWRTNGLFEVMTCSVLRLLAIGHGVLVVFHPAPFFGAATVSPKPGTATHDPDKW